MAVFFHPNTSDVSFEVAEYESFPRSESTEAPVRSSKPKFKHVSVLLLSFGLLCVIQATLNISLRLTLSTNSVAVSSTAGPTTETQRPWTQETKSCPKDWLLFGSSCYYISLQSKTWEDSRHYCRQRGADLVVINSRQEQAFLTGFTSAAWVGMTDRRREGTFVWVDGTPVNKNRLQFATGQPDDSNGQEDCGDLRTMVDFIGLNDFVCNATIQWICEKTLP